MPKIVVNRRHGGFSLSPEATRHFAHLSGTPVVEEVPHFGGFTTTYWTALRDDPRRAEYEVLSSHEWWSLTEEERERQNALYRELTVDIRTKDRTDPHLVETVETLGEQANGKFAKLEVVEIPDDVDWEIDNYDGLERIHEKHRVW